ncbi:hypothetical protein WJX72_002045 [[Myrmecia] bisecta]|uniref:DNA repair protein RAD50 n=1 Tax=[Myrmecia] bisecta TaxID=41462 RepID=A0AAW1QA17_9CHLO
MACTIDKMLIKGIRSFSPDNQNVIEFYKPLTLIVGHNGAGKTTIIECLKQACTGELPPNTRSGQSFIHDPKVAGETEVKAQIKLRFRTSTGQPVVVIRTFQLTQKKTALQFKALDQTLQTFNKDTGQKEALSYRCADIDRIVPTLMGVSKAILENVIFVHQEDSNWPLSEGQVLKKKFDDIFAATKYTKALEALRKLRTEKVSEAKQFKLLLDHLTTHKDTATKLRSEIADNREKDRSHMEQIQAFDQEMQELETARNELNTKLNAIIKCDEEIKSLKTQHGMLTRQNAETKVRLLSSGCEEEDLNISIEELEESIADMAPNVNRHMSELYNLERTILAKKAEIEAMKDAYSRDVKLHGRMAAEGEAHRRNVADRDRFVRATVTQHGLGQVPGDGELSTQAVAGVARTFEERLQGLQGQLQQLKDNSRQQDDQMGHLIDRVTADITATTEGARMKQDQLRRNDARLNQLSNEAATCAVSPAMLEDVVSREKAAETDMVTRKQNLERAKLDQEVLKHTAALDELQRRASQLRQEREKLSRAAEGATRQKIKRQEVLQKEAEVHLLISNKRDKLSHLLNVRSADLPAPSNLKAAVGEALTKKRAELATKGTELRDAQNRSSSAEGALSAARSQLHRQTQELAAARQQIRTGLTQVYGEAREGPLGEYLKEAETKRVEHSEQMQRIQALNVSITHNKRMAQQNHVCYTCGRQLHAGAELDAFLARQAEQARSVPQTLQKLGDELHRTEDRLTALKQLQPAFLRFEALKDKEIPASEQRVAALEGQVQQDMERVEELQQEYGLMEHEQKDGAKLQQEVVWNVDRLQKEVDAGKAEIDALQAQHAASGAGRSVADVDEDLDRVEGEKAGHERQKDELLRKQARLRDEVAAATAEWHKVREELQERRRLMERRAELDRQRADLEAQNGQMRTQMDQMQASKQPLEQKKKELAREREEKRRDARTRETEMEARLRELHNHAHALRSKIQAVEEYLQAGKAAQLQQMTASLDAAKRRQDAGELQLKELEEEQKTKTSELKGQDDLRRQIEDILVWRRSSQREAEIGTQINALQSKIAEVGDQRIMDEQYTNLQRQAVEKRRRQDMLRGSLATIQETIKRAERDLSAAQYRDIDLRYRKQLIELRTTEMVNTDLEKYHKALEKALLSFHTTKMADINKIIKELWQKTYRNQDIDYIQIKADADGQRSYNYRVVMVSGGAELDMRGRCSAGQKVLACLIIRLALAETFCLNCGILALDEPTTNLDADNSASLADALRNIMQTRQQQENFQLIVITHDEKFANLIGTREHAEHRWRITKDENQHSHIAQEDLAD